MTSRCKHEIVDPNGAIAKAIQESVFRYSPEIRSHVASYHMMTKDIREIFEYIEPNKDNLSTYSHRNYELLLRTCTEVESIFKMMFHLAKVKIEKKNINQYSMVEPELGLSFQKVTFRGMDLPKFTPFELWGQSDVTSDGSRGPEWYSDYNKVKHNRSGDFSKANLRNILSGFSAVEVLLRLLVRADSESPFSNPDVPVLPSSLIFRSYV